METQFEFMLTTIDNPFDPFEQFDEWLAYDNEHNYNSCSYLGRVVNLNDALSEKETNDEIERAIDEIIKNDFLGIRKKVKRKIEVL